MDGMTLLGNAANNGIVEHVKILLEAGYDPNIRTVYKDYSPLMWAAKSGSLECVDVLLKAGADASVQNKNGETALLIAVINGHKSVIEHFLREKDLLHTLNGSHICDYILSKATECISYYKSKYHEIVVMLIKHGIDVNAKNKRERDFC
jgi:ankyrin repeat protein